MSEQKARVTVKREHSFYSCAVIFGVYIDGAKVGSVANGGESKLFALLERIKND